MLLWLFFQIVAIGFSLVGSLMLKMECSLLLFGEQFEVIITEPERVMAFDFLSIFQCDCFGIRVVVLIFTPSGVAVFVLLILMLFLWQSV